MISKSSFVAASLFSLSSIACSSAGFDVGGSSDDAGDDTSIVSDSTTSDTTPGADTRNDSAHDDTISGDDSKPTTDSSIGADTTPPPDTAPPPDTKPVDTGCEAGITQACECSGTRTCKLDGTWSTCVTACASPRFSCLYGVSGCTNPLCLDDHNCQAPSHCNCAAYPGSTCELTDPCWGPVCNGMVCPSM